MGKVHKSLRIDEELAAAVSAIGCEGETEAATYNRIIAAGVEALSAQGADSGEQPAQAGSSNDAALIEALKAHVETLKADNERLGGQLEIKDRQIEALSVLTAQAQQTATKALEAPKEKQEQQEQQQPAQGGEQKRGFWARLFG